MNFTSLICSVLGVRELQENKQTNKYMYLCMYVYVIKLYFKVTVHMENIYSA